MNELGKKILIVNGVFLVLFLLLVILEILFYPGVLPSLMLYANLFLIPIFIVVMCLIYQHNNLDSAGYGKSLLMPLSYILFGAILVFSWVTFTFEGEMVNWMLFFYLIHFGVTFVAVSVINLSYLLIRKLFFT